MSRTLDEQREATAKKLTEETGYLVQWRKSCFLLWENAKDNPQGAIFPLYTVAQVLNCAGRLRSRRS